MRKDRIYNAKKKSVDTIDHKRAGVGVKDIVCVVSPHNTHMSVFDTPRVTGKKSRFNGDKLRKCNTQHREKKLHYKCHVCFYTKLFSRYKVDSCKKLTNNLSNNKLMKY